jgi:hypothetical protein
VLAIVDREAMGHKEQRQLFDAEVFHLCLCHWKKAAISYV